MGIHSLTLTMLSLVLLSLVAAALAEPFGYKFDQREWSSSDPEIGKYIVGGRKAADGAWPWQLSLQFFGSHTCGAVLVSKKWALTAAHCIDGRNNAAYFKLVGGTNKQDGSGIVMDIEQMFPHPGFVGNPLLGFPDDIALIKLASEATLGPKVNVALMPPSGMDFTGNKDCWISGWGKTYWADNGIPMDLQEANIQIPTNNACQARMSAPILETHICAGLGDGASACSGDSGGPMSCKVGDKWYVSGLTSFGIVTCSGFPSVYTRVSEYESWINDIIS